MSRSFNRLQRVLDLEVKQGYKNTAVVGGIRQFATFWVGQAREEIDNELDAFLVEQIADVLAGYDRLPGPEARAKAIATITNQLQQQRARSQANKPTAVAAKENKPKQRPPSKKEKESRHSQP